MASGSEAGLTRRMVENAPAAGRAAALLMAAVLIAPAARAQEVGSAVVAPPDSLAASDAEDLVVPDLEITATVRYRQLRFDVVGEPRVEFSGSPERKTIWDAQRINLPRPVQPGVVYRDGGVRLTISSMFAALSRLYSTPEDPQP